MGKFGPGPASCPLTGTASISDNLKRFVERGAAAQEQARAAKRARKQIQATVVAMRHRVETREIRLPVL